MDEFLKKIKDNENEIKSEDAYSEIVNKLLDKKLKGEDKTDGFLDAYDSEDTFNGKPCIGNIYIMHYLPKDLTKYDYKNKSVLYTDTEPVVLLTKVSNTYMRGINLNFCNKGLKTIILNIILNLDLDFYNGDNAKMANRGDKVFSKKVYETMMNPEFEAQFIHLIKTLTYNEANISLLFRNYSLECIKDFRLIEAWQWEFIPFLDYSGNAKRDTMSAIHKILNIDAIKI